MRQSKNNLNQDVRSSGVTAIELLVIVLVFLGLCVASCLIVIHQKDAKASGFDRAAQKAQQQIVPTVRVPRSDAVAYVGPRVAQIKISRLQPGSDLFKFRYRIEANSDPTGARIKFSCKLDQLPVLDCSRGYFDSLVVPGPHSFSVSATVGRTQGPVTTLRFTGAASYSL